MEKYDYMAHLVEDVRQYVEDEIQLENYQNEDELYQDLYEKCLDADSVTGNASGSYTFNTWRAEENLCHNFDLLCEAAEEFDSPAQISTEYHNGAEYWDVVIRIYLLPRAIEQVIKDLEIGEED